jgi:hypothetical protein
LPCNCLTPKWISLGQIRINETVKPFCVEFVHQPDRCLAILARMADKEHLCLRQPKSPDRRFAKGRTLQQCIDRFTPVIQHLFFPPEDGAEPHRVTVSIGQPDIAVAINEKILSQARAVGIEACMKTGYCCGRGPRDA